MPETRYKEIYQDGVLIERIPCEVSNEELHQEALATEANDKSHDGLAAFNNWDRLYPLQKDTVLKNVLWYLLYKEGLL